MAKNIPTKDPDTLAEVAGKVFSGIITVFTLIVLAVFPLYYHNYYFDILKAKYKFYWITIVAMLAVCLVTALVFCFVDWMECGSVNTKRFFSRFKPEHLKKQPLAYKMLAGFWIFTAISTLLSDYRYESFWGNEGRFSGLFLITLYTAGVFVVGKLGRVRKWHLDLFLLSGLLVCLFGITDYFRMDILGWKSYVESKQVDMFTSTLGNINTYTAFVALVLGVSGGLFATEENLFRRLWYFAVTAVGFFAIITGQSDNAYLTLGALFALLPFALFGTWRGVAGYATLAATFATVIRVIARINEEMADTVLGLKGIFDVLADHEKLGDIVIALWVLSAVLWGISFFMTRGGRKDHIGLWLRGIWLVIVAVAAVAVLYVFYDANFGDTPEKYAAYAKYLVFNDNWGTNRGYCWRIGWESYKKLPALHKLFGYGADTYGILTWDFRQEAIDMHGVFYESAHNEYLQYLVTIGPFAVLFYVLFLGSGCAAMMKAFGKKPWVVGPCAAVICYAVQAVVNINLPIATPVMWWLMALGLAVSRESAKEKQKTGDAAVDTAA